MKISKLMLIPCIAIASLMPIASCAVQTEAEQISHCIFDPIGKQKEKISSFKDSLKSLNEDQLNNELLYDLFAFGFKSFKSIINLKTLYENGTIDIKTNISEMSLKFDGETLKASFLGYVAFIFQKDYDDVLKTNDYAMCTFSFSNKEVTLNETECSLLYQDTYSSSCVIGILELRLSGGSERHNISIDKIDTSSDSTIPTNSKNWTK